MENPGDSPKATRKRVWRFAFGCVGVVLVVGLWPLKGYRIRADEDGYSEAINQILKSTSLGTTSSMLIKSSETSKQGRASFDNFMSGEGLQPEETYSPEIKAFGADVCFVGSEHFGNSFAFRYRNLYGYLNWYDDAPPPGRTWEGAQRDALEVILHGIEREIPGVTTFYNPPTRQLWHDRVRPFVGKHFPTLLYLRNDTH